MSALVRGAVSAIVAAYFGGVASVTPVSSAPIARVAQKYSLHTLYSAYKSPVALGAINDEDDVAATIMLEVGPAPQCVLFDASRMTPFINAASLGTCSVAGISNRNSANRVRVIGSEQTAFETEPIAYAATIGNTGSVDLLEFPNSKMTLSGVNVNGAAVGTGYFASYHRGGLFTTAPPFFLATGARTLALAQPGCVSALPYCLDTSKDVPGCGFGGCVIDDDGFILGTDASNGKLMIAEAKSQGGAPMGRDLPIVATSTISAYLNDRKQVMYATPDATFVYDISTGKTDTVGGLKGMQCTYRGFSFSNDGRVLGSASCSSGNVYFTWDRTDGASNLSAEIPHIKNLAGISPAGINDYGDIVVEYTTVTPPDGGTYWIGILFPPGRSARSRS